MKEPTAVNFRKRTIPCISRIWIINAVYIVIPTFDLETQARAALAPSIRITLRPIRQARQIFALSEERINHGSALVGIHCQGGRFCALRAKIRALRKNKERAHFFHPTSSLTRHTHLKARRKQTRESPKKHHCEGFAERRQSMIVNYRMAKRRSRSFCSILQGNEGRPTGLTRLLFNVVQRIRGGPARGDYVPRRDWRLHALASQTVARTKKGFQVRRGASQ